MRLGMKGQGIRMECLVGHLIPVGDLAGVALENPSVFRQAYFASRPLHQLNAQLLFKFSNVLAYCRLADAQFICCGREIAAFHYRQEYLYFVIFQHICKYNK